jgi:hypothetical protein
MDKHAHLIERQFRLAARRNRLVGLWAAQRLGKTGVAAETYAIEVVLADLLEPGDDDVIFKLRADFVAGGVDVTATEIMAKLHEVGDAARRQVTH